MIVDSCDTSTAARALMIEGYRRMSASEKLARVCDLGAAARALAAARIREQHPGIFEVELRLRLASLWFDRRTMARAFGWDPARQGY